MTLKCIATGSDGNSYAIKADNGEILLLDAGIPIDEIKKGIGFDVGHLEGCVVSHEHKDHSLSVSKLRKMGVPMLLPYRLEAKRLRTMIGSYIIESFPVPHNGVENRAFLITIDGVKILYATDYEYIPYDLSNQGINIALVEMNYQTNRIADMDEHRRHVVLGHAEEKTVIDFLSTIKKNLRKVILCHMSKSGSLDKRTAMDNLREVIPEYISIDWATAGESYNISTIPF